MKEKDKLDLSHRQSEVSLKSFDKYPDEALFMANMPNDKKRMTIRASHL